MSMLGRFRRRMATMSLASLLRAGVCEQLVEPRKVLRVCSLAVQVRAGGQRGAVHCDCVCVQGEGATATECICVHL